MNRDVGLVVAALQRAFPSGPSRGKFDSWDFPPLNVLDCVLSLNRNYDSFCLPRVERFKQRHPEIDSLQGLLRLIRSYASPLAFSVRELEYNDDKRAAVLVGVLEHLIDVQKPFTGASELARLIQWANSVTPSDYQTPGVPGFGISGFQYLRMLFGAQTAKPDMHIRRFVSAAVGRPVDEVSALTLLEGAGGQLGWPLTDLDYAIWEKLARGTGGTWQPPAPTFGSSGAKPVGNRTRYTYRLIVNGKMLDNMTPASRPREPLCAVLEQ